MLLFNIVKCENVSIWQCIQVRVKQMKSTRKTVWKRERETKRKKIHLLKRNELWKREDRSYQNYAWHMMLIDE